MVIIRCFELMLETAALLSMYKVSNFTLSYAPMCCRFVVLSDSFCVSRAGVMQHYKRTITHGRIKGSKIRNYIHWRKCSSFQHQFRRTWCLPLGSKYASELKFKLNFKILSCPWGDEIRSAAGCMEWGKLNAFKISAHSVHFTSRKGTTMTVGHGVGCQNWSGNRLWECELECTSSGLGPVDNDESASSIRTFRLLNNHLVLEENQFHGIIHLSSWWQFHRPDVRLVLMQSGDRGWKETVRHFVFPGDRNCWHEVVSLCSCAWLLFHTSQNDLWKRSVVCLIKYFLSSSHLLDRKWLLFISLEKEVPKFNFRCLTWKWELFRVWFYYDDPPS